MLMMRDPKPLLPTSTRVEFYSTSPHQGWGVALAARFAPMMKNGWLQDDGPSRPSPQAFKTIPLQHGCVLLPYVRGKRKNAPYAPPTPMLLAKTSNQGIKPYLWPLTFRGREEEMISLLYSDTLSFLDDPTPALTPEEATPTTPISPAVALQTNTTFAALLDRGDINAMAYAASRVFDIPIASLSLRGRRITPTGLDTKGFLSIHSTTESNDPAYKMARESLLSLLLTAYPDPFLWLANTFSKDNTLVTPSIKPIRFYETKVTSPKSAHDHLLVEKYKHDINALNIPDPVS